MEECRVAYRTAADWFAFWGRGDMTEAEAVVIAGQVAQHSRQEVGGGPLLRAQSARWLCFDAAGASGPAALLHANTLCREFALGESAQLCRGMPCAGSSQAQGGGLGCSPQCAVHFSRSACSFAGLVLPCSGAG
jgi:hypothetical protein